MQCNHLRNHINYTNLQKKCDLRIMHECHFTLKVCLPQFESNLCKEFERSLLVAEILLKVKEHFFLHFYKRYFYIAQHNIIFHIVTKILRKALFAKISKYLSMSFKFT